MGYDISADYVDSTTTYEPRSTTIIDSDFIGGHSKYILRFKIPISLTLEIPRKMYLFFIHHFKPDIHIYPFLTAL
jgi:hypothetical protein